ncbi:MAG: PilW family protein [Gemmatimonadota bacterium]
MGAGRRETVGRRPAKGGFTLVELIIAITVATVLGAGILGLLLGQNRFYGETDDAIYAEQSIRAAMDLMAAEMRMASPSDLTAAAADSVSARFDLVRSVVCDVTGGDQADLFVYDTVSNANLPASFRGAATSGPYDSAFVYADGWTGTVSVSAAAKTTCVNNGSPSLTDNTRYRRVTGWAAGFGSVPARGSIVRTYGRLTYRFAASGLGSGQAVWRNAQELVSPFDTGARFRYEMADGTIQNSVVSAQLDQVRMIHIEATAIGDGANRYDVKRDIAYVVPLRN